MGADDWFDLRFGILVIAVGGAMMNRQRIFARQAVTGHRRLVGPAAVIPGGFGKAVGQHTPLLDLRNNKQARFDPWPAKITQNMPCLRSTDTEAAQPSQLG